MGSYLVRANRIPMACLGWQSPLQKHFSLLTECQETKWKTSGFALALSLGLSLSLFRLSFSHHWLMNKRRVLQRKKNMIKTIEKHNQCACHKMQNMFLLFNVWSYVASRRMSLSVHQENARGNKESERPWDVVEADGWLNLFLNLFLSCFIAYSRAFFACLKNER